MGTDARKINDFLFPYPYAQMIQVMLMAHSVSTPLICSMVVNDTVCAALLAFLATLSLWSINFIGAELEMPFGDDYNDLPVRQMQKDLNRSLCTLVAEGVRYPPTY